MTDPRRSRGRSRGSDEPPERPAGAERIDRSSTDADRSTPVIPSPAWVPTDDVMGPRADRQILVVGTTPTGLTLALLLGAAGYEPLVVSGGDVPVMSQHTYLSPAALEVLGVLDLGVRVHDRGSAVDGITVRCTDGSGVSDPVDVVTAGATDRKRAPPVVVPTPVLLRVLRDAVPTTVTVQDRAVDSVSRRAAGITVIFDDGVRESFDVVVGVGGRNEPLRSDDQGTDSVFQQYETVVDSAIEEQSVRDVWAPDAVAQRLPGAAGDLVRITIPDDKRDARDARAAFSNLRWVPDSGAFGRRQVLQRRLPDGDVPEAWWGDGRVARCGPAACPAAPAAGVGQSLGITDALGLVSVLARDVDASTAVETYATARARRLGELRRAVTRMDSRASVPCAPDRRFGSFHALRAIALEPFLGTAPEPLGASVLG
jgi:2-polyprenyl-6-methoxyphenol hydroxylase-like FAD-dependent oxidoreductase